MGYNEQSQNSENGVCQFLVKPHLNDELARSSCIGAPPDKLHQAVDNICNVKRLARWETMQSRIPEQTDEHNYSSAEELSAKSEPGRAEEGLHRNGVHRSDVSAWQKSHISENPQKSHISENPQNLELRNLRKK